MSLFSYLDTRAPSVEEIKKIEAEYDDDGNVKEPTWLDEYELQTEMTLQRLTSFFGSLSVICAIIGLACTVWASITTAGVEGDLSKYSALILVGGLFGTAVTFGLLRLAK
ncbi:MAG: hypothetical protein E7559_06885, partial [Ruminococcaceae bacterium]|nr:hypothetical protein [Oscillospiraceae bacterium]